MLAPQEKFRLWILGIRWRLWGLEEPCLSVTFWLPSAAANATQLPHEQWRAARQLVEARFGDSASVNPLEHEFVDYTSGYQVWRGTFMIS